MPAGTFNAVGAGTATGLNPLSGVSELTADGKPEVLYIGGEFCPFCAAERWALATALSRFGTLSGVSFIHSSPTDGDIPTLTFYKSSYTSKYLTFTPVEWFGEADDASTPFGHVYLQQPTAQEAALFARYAKRLDTVPGHRQPVPAPADSVLTGRPFRPHLGADSHGDAGSLQSRRQGHRRRREHG